MATKITDYKTKRINTLTGGSVGDWHKDNKTLPNSFISPTGVYIGDYGDGWSYVQNNMLVCREKPNGVAIQLNCPAKDYPFMETYLETGKVDCDHKEAFFAFGNKKGEFFKIGDRVYDPDYIPQKEDYTIEQWTEFNIVRTKFVQKAIDGLKDDQKIFKIVEDNPIIKFVPLNLRGKVVIQRWDQAQEAAIKLANLL